MPTEHRLYLAITEARRRMRSGEPAHKVAASMAWILDVDAQQVQRLAIVAEEACEQARTQLATAKEARRVALYRARAEVLP